MRHVIKEILVLVPGSIAAGWFVGTVQHYVAFAALGGGFAVASLELAFFEGGIVGGAAGIPTGLVTYYLALGRRVTPMRVAAVVIGSLLLGCSVTLVGLRMMGDGFVPISVLTTPALTVAVATIVNRLRPA